MCEFYSYDRVLVRDNEHEEWRADIFSRKINDHIGYNYECIGYTWKKCIPYEGNEHLLGTFNSPAPKWEPKCGEPVAVRDSIVQDWSPRVFMKKCGDSFYTFSENEDGIGWNICEPFKKHFNIQE